MNTIIKKLILFLVRKRLHLGKYELFQFSNQKSNALYYFGDEGLMKVWRGIIEPSGVSLNWLLSDEIEIVEVDVGNDIYINI